MTSNLLSSTGSESLRTVSLIASFLGGVLSIFTVSESFADDAVTLNNVAAPSVNTADEEFAKDASSDDVIRHGVKWLKSNQRESGRWYTR